LVVIRCAQEVDVAERANSKFKRAQTSADMPQVLDYVHQKAREHELRAEVKNIERKLELAEVGVKRARVVLRQAQTLGWAVGTGM